MNTKAFLAIALTFGVVGFAVMPIATGLTAQADTVDLADQTFIDFVMADTDYEGTLTFTHSPLYNEDLEVSGREYDFAIGDAQGYALMAEIQVDNQVFYEVEELFYGRTSPFEECIGLPVYLTHRVYLDCVEGVFYNLEDNQEVPQEVVAQLAEKGFLYQSGVATQPYSQTVNYSTKDTVTYEIQYEMPDYESQEGANCVNIAGCIILAYYDRFYETLIPNFQSYSTFGSEIVYSFGGAEIEALGVELNTLMGGGEGATFSQFQNGMTSYVSGKGYTYSSQTMFTNGLFNYANYQTAVHSGKPVAVFMSGFSLLRGVVENGTSDTVYNTYFNGAHAMVAYGYRTDTYYDTNGNAMSVRKYLKVATGLAIYGLGYLNIDGLGNMDRAISVDIY